MRRLRSPTRLTARALRSKPDDCLVALWRDGCELAFEEIVRRHRGELVARAAAISGAHHAEDVVQVALVKAHEAVCRTAPDTRLRPWLYAIVRNAALDSARREGRHKTIEISPELPSERADVLAQRESLADLVAGLRRLPEAQRAALVQRELEGRSYEEISRSLETTPAGARGLIYRARRHLRNGLGAATPIGLAQGILARIAGRTAEGASAGGGVAITTSSGTAAVLKAGALVTIVAFGTGTGLVPRGGDSRRDSGSVAAQLDALPPNVAARLDGRFLAARQADADGRAGRTSPQRDSEADAEARPQPAEVADAGVDASGPHQDETADVEHPTSHDGYHPPTTGTDEPESGNAPESHPDLVGDEEVPTEPEPAVQGHGPAAGHDTAGPARTALPAG